MDDIEKIKNLSFLLIVIKKKILQIYLIANLLYIFTQKTIPQVVKARKAIALILEKTIGILGFKIFGVSKDNIEKHKKLLKSKLRS